MGTIKRVGLVIGGVLLLLGVFYAGLWIWGAWHDEWSGFNASVRSHLAYCNIALVPIVGDIYLDEPSHDGSEYLAVTNADEVVAMIRDAERNPYIEGILVRIDSLGGTPVASEIIMNAIRRSSLPSAALIREYGTSGGYLVASAADVVFASPFSDVGGIGITMSYVESSEKNRRDGLQFVSLASAPFKDYGSPDKPLTAAERALLERDLEIFHAEFVALVAENRNLPVREVEVLADGSSFPGSLAVEKNLVDFVGGEEDALEWFAEKLGLPSEYIIVCDY